MKTPQLLEFNEWQQHMIAATPDTKPVDCPICDGDGETECECCGAATECEECNDNCQVLFDGLSESQQKDVFSYQAYQNKSIEDIKALATWQGTNLYEALIHYGYTAFAYIKNKQECIVEIGTGNHRMAHP